MDTTENMELRDIPGDFVNANYYYYYYFIIIIIIIMFIFVVFT